ncbi:MAG TPA: hypothetical protein VFW07_28935 [Parafilimonas sp.]|nr:hypothetical protein [Parafilimonas sp.]
MSILDELSRLPVKSNEAEKLIDYYQANKTRMNYPLYNKLGTGIIGSGAIEPAQYRSTEKIETIRAKME